MFEIVYQLLDEFIEYLPEWSLIIIVLSIVGSMVFNKK